MICSDPFMVGQESAAWQPSTPKSFGAAFGLCHGQGPGEKLKIQDSGFRQSAALPDEEFTELDRAKIAQSAKGLPESVQLRALGPGDDNADPTRCQGEREPGGARLGQLHGFEDGVEPFVVDEFRLAIDSVEAGIAGEEKLG